MTSRRNHKQAIRARMAITGERYNVAARALRSPTFRPAAELPRRIPGAHLILVGQLPLPRRPLVIRRDPAALTEKLSTFLQGWEAGRAALVRYRVDRRTQAAGSRSGSIG
ncbi:hypothetical protein O7634_12525 [Micromonospora sp. WMMD1120]|uniref:hypothetical protein n=1 Tax=Micromonospora sp. WMMD1120 TaxID=3016106 RepID=UPI002416DA34|nr:hypothetical protein [Micromonospora sp. WMMD1120]MDG4807577.1 hypothetical protein [Micromonospora sp. WMMD1120]